MITAAQAATVKPAEVKLTAEKPQNSVRYFTDWALPQLDTLIDEREKPIDVWTTIDLSMQRQATAAIVANAPRGAQGAHWCRWTVTALCARWLAAPIMSPATITAR